ncbi:MAG: hypothetical protein ACK506_20860 [Pirellula sp.]
MTVKSHFFFFLVTVFILTSSSGLAGYQDTPESSDSPERIIQKIQEADARIERLLENSSVRIESQTVRLDGEKKQYSSRSVLCRRRANNLLAIVDQISPEGRPQVICCLNRKDSYYFRLQKLADSKNYELKNLELQPNEFSDIELSQFFLARTFYRTVPGESLSSILSQANRIETKSSSGNYRPIKVIGFIPSGNYEKIEMVVLQDLDFAIESLRIDFRGSNAEESITTKVHYGSDKLPSTVEIHQRTQSDRGVFEGTENLTFGEFQFDVPPAEVFELEHYGISGPAKPEKQTFWMILLASLSLLFLFYLTRRRRPSPPTKSGG